MKIHHLGAKDYVTGKWYKVYHPTPYTLYLINPLFMEKQRRGMR